MYALLLVLDPHLEGSDEKISHRTASEDIINQKIPASFFSRGPINRILRESAYSRVKRLYTVQCRAEGLRMNQPPTGERGGHVLDAL